MKKTALNFQGRESFLTQSSMEKNAAATVNIFWAKLRKFSISNPFQVNAQFPYPLKN